MRKVGRLNSSKSKASNFIVRRRRRKRRRVDDADSAHAILHLQKTIGNRATIQMLQKKITFNRQRSNLKQDEDQLARHAVNETKTENQLKAQRQEEEETAQAKFEIQRQETEEEEQAQTHPTEIQRQVAPEEEESVQVKPVGIQCQTETRAIKKEVSGKIKAKVIEGSKEGNPAIIWRKKGYIVAILEFDNNESLHRYLKGEVTDAELVSKKQAVWTQMPLTISKEDLPKPDETEKEAGEAERQKKPMSAFEWIWEKIRTKIERATIKGNLLLASYHMKRGNQSKAESALKNAADLATSMLKRKIALLDVKSAKKEMITDLMKTAEDVLTLGGDDTAVETAMQKSLTWSKNQLDSAINILEKKPTRQNAKEVVVKAGNVLLFGGEYKAVEPAMQKTLSWAEAELKKAVAEFTANSTKAGANYVIEMAKTVMNLGGDPGNAIDLVKKHYPK